MGLPNLVCQSPNQLNRGSDVALISIPVYSRYYIPISFHVVSAPRHCHHAHVGFDAKHNMESVSEQLEELQR